MVIPLNRPDEIFESARRQTMERIGSFPSFPPLVRRPRQERHPSVMNAGVFVYGYLVLRDDAEYPSNRDAGPTAAGCLRTLPR